MITDIRFNRRPRLPPQTRLPHSLKQADKFAWGRQSGPWGTRHGYKNLFVTLYAQFCSDLTRWNPAVR